MQGKHEDGRGSSVATDILYTQSEVCSLCRITVTTLSSYIEYGLIEEPADEQLRFEPAHVIRILKANKLQRELELDLAHLALVVDLLDTIDVQRRELDVLRKLVV